MRTFVDDRSQIDDPVLVSIRRADAQLGFEISARAPIVDVAFDSAVDRLPFVRNPRREAESLQELWGRHAGLPFDVDAADSRDRTRLDRENQRGAIRAVAALRTKSDLWMEVPSQPQLVLDQPGQVGSASKRRR